MKSDVMSLLGAQPAAPPPEWSRWDVGVLVLTSPHATPLPLARGPHGNHGPDSRGSSPPLWHLRPGAPTSSMSPRGWRPHFPSSWPALPTPSWRSPARPHVPPWTPDWRGGPCTRHHRVHGPSEQRGTAVRSHMGGRVRQEQTANPTRDPEGGGPQSGSPPASPSLQPPHG